MTAPRRPRLKLRGPLERDLQPWILSALGDEQREPYIDRNGKPRWRRLNVYLTRDGLGMLWRANSGFVRAPSGVPLRVGSPGMADILGIYCTVPVALEIKREGEKPTPDQIRWAEWWTARGGVYAVVRCPSDVHSTLQQIREQYNATGNVEHQRRAV